jgi:outer membrane immunogenic protein
MKRLFAFCVTFAACVDAAAAADMTPYPEYQPVLRPVYNWTGCSVGVNIGGGDASKSWTDTVGTFGGVYGTTNGPPGADLGHHYAPGAIGGGQIGCDYQAGNFVFGIQGLYDLTGMKGYNAQPNVQPPTLNTLANHSFIQSIGTLTGRIGYTVQPTLLLYGRAGGAWAHDLYNVSTFLVPGSATVVSSTGTIIALGSNSPGGWTAGAGLEWAFFGGDFSAFLEYDYMSFRSSRVTFIPTTPALGATSTPAFPLDISQHVNVFLFGINYRFHAGPRW